MCMHVSMCGLENIFQPVTEENISIIIKKIKNKCSYGHDLLSNIMIKKAHDPPIKPLTLLINQSLSSGVLPNHLKISRVKPLFKRGNALLYSNYRPISILPSLSKIYEYAVFEQLSAYMERKCLFYCDQYGFKQGHSTELASVRFVNDLIKMDNFKIPTSILIDLSKAFDTLDHGILLSKLQYYGITGIELNFSIIISPKEPNMSITSELAQILNLLRWAYSKDQSWDHYYF